MKLRPYQQKGIDLLRSRIVAGDSKIIEWLQTGAGKGLMMSEINRLNREKNNRVLNIMRRRELIHQTKNNFKKYHGIDSSIIMGSEKGFDRSNPVQIGSIDTLQRRYENGALDYLLDFDTVIIDEAHDTTSNKYREFLNWLDTEKKKIFVGFTATPFNVGKRVHDWWDSCVKPIEAHELRDMGYLVHDRIYAPKKIDLSKLRKMQGDYHNGDLYDKMTELKVIGDVVESYKKYGHNKPAVLFAVNIEHSKVMVEAFKKAGIPAAHYDQGDSSDLRQEGIQRLKTGEIKILCNVNIFSTGCDIPFAEVGILARPTMSEILDIQQRGRILRPYKICGDCGNEYGGDATCFKCGSHFKIYEKPHAILLDHANNVDRHGLTYDVRKAAMTEFKKKTTTELLGQEINIKQCPNCFLYTESKTKSCEHCGFIFLTDQRTFKTEDGELIFLDQKALRQKMLNKINIRWSYHQEAMRFNGQTDRNYPYKQIFYDFGVDVFEFIKFPPALEKQLRFKSLLKSRERVFS